ncbi:unnamed protein product [Laminaria digitata]
MPTPQEDNADGASPQTPTAAQEVARHPGGECTICLSDDVESPVQTNCGHWYCAGCILGWVDTHHRGRISCPVCREEVTMIHRGLAADAPEAASSPASPPVAPDSAAESETQERIARFNERSSWRQRTLWQTARDSPLLLRRLWSDLRRGDAHVIGEMIGRGVQLQVLIVVVYIFCPFDILPESIFGIVGLLDDLIIALVLLLYITTVYRTMLLSWERARMARAATTAAATAAAATAGAGGPAPTNAVPGEAGGVDTGAGPGGAALLAVVAGALATFAGAGAGLAALAACFMGVFAAVIPSLLNARAAPPLAARDR